MFAPTLIFYEIVFNLGTMMQAAGRSYRLNQTHSHCKTYYLFCEGTMEQTAVQLMSRKQRAAKLLTGDIGLTGLDALTEGEGGFEEALLEAIGRDDALLDPSELFKQSQAQGEIDTEDAAYWNVELNEPETVQTVLADDLYDDPLIRDAIRLGGVVAEIGSDQPVAKVATTILPVHEPQQFMQAIAHYLDDVHLISDDGKRAKLQAKLLLILTNGVQADDSRYRVVGMGDPDFDRYPVHEETLTRHVRSWLKEHRFVFAGCEGEVATQIIRLAKQALNSGTSNSIQLRPVVVSTPSRKPAASKSNKRKTDLLTVPDDRRETPSKHRSNEQIHETAPMQLALF